MEPAKVPAIDIAGKMPWLAGGIHPARSAWLGSLNRFARLDHSRLGYVAVPGHVSLQPVRHARKVNECITAVNFYTASIQENNQYTWTPGKPEGALIVTRN